MSKQYMRGGGYGRKLSIDPSICPPVLGAKFNVLECLWPVQRQDERFVVVFFKEKKSSCRVGRCTWEGSRGSGNRMETKGGSIATLSILSSY